MRARQLILVAAALACGCGDAIISGANGPGSGGGSAYGVSGIGCDVATVLATKCISCHHSPPTGGAPYALVTRDQLLAPAPGFAGQTVAERCLARMKAATSPMPPAPASPATAAEIATYEGWVDAGMPAGTCNMGPTCASQTFYPPGAEGSGDMNPGEACKACHASEAPSRVYAYMGTVFPSMHEQNRCLANPPAGVRVEILDQTGAVVATMTPFASSGNFYSHRSTALVAPYTARVVSGTRMSVMTTPQTDGDCNTCHSQDGLNGAPGRIIWP